MRLITINVNGVRAAARKGFFDWLPAQQADVICLQETRAHPEQISDALYHPAGYHCYYEPAERKGYSGVGLFVRREPDELIRGFGSAEFDAEGRYLEARYGKLSVISVYMPSGTSSEERLAAKFRFMDEFREHMAELRGAGRQSILCGDWNIAHREIDLKNWRANQKNSGFLPEERAWLDRIFAAGWVDGFRLINQEAEQYTWWSNRGQAWAKNVGWRIDYQVVTQALAPAVQAASIYREQRFSDHAPLIMDYRRDLLPGTEPV